MRQAATARVTRIRRGTANRYRKPVPHRDIADALTARKQLRS